MRLTYLLLIGLVGWAVPASAQFAANTSVPTDTIGISRQRQLFSTYTTYSFGAAQQLTGRQLMPVLLATSDSAIVRLTGRSRRRYRLSAPSLIGSYGLFIGSIRVLRTNPESILAEGLAIGGLALLTEGLVAGLSAPRPLWRAATRYNQLQLAQTYGYARPTPTESERRLTLADTVSRQPNWRGSRYTYRGITVSPERHLQAAMQSFNDPFLAEGLRQNRIIRGVAGLISTTSFLFLSSYAVDRLRRPGAVSGRGTNPLVYAAVGGIGVSLVVGRMADRTTRQLVQRYNQHLTRRP